MTSRVSLKRFDETNERDNRLVYGAYSRKEVVIMVLNELPTQFRIDSISVRQVSDDTGEVHKPPRIQNGIKWTTQNDLPIQ